MWKEVVVTSFKVLSQYRRSKTHLEQDLMIYNPKRPVKKLA